MDEQLEEQASLYALGVLEGEELRAFEAQLATNNELRRFVDELTASAAQIAHAAAPRPLPAHLESRILDEIRAGKTIAVAPQASAATSWIPWAIAACLAVACVVVFAQQQRTANELAAAREKEAAAQAKMAELAQERDRAQQQVAQLEQREADARAQMVTLAAARDETAKKLAQAEARAEREANKTRDALAQMQVAMLTSKISDAPEATAAIVWDPDLQRGVLNTANVPPDGADRDYQLWIVDPRYSQPVDAGVFSVEKTGSTRYVFKPKSPITSATAFAITLERKGGVPKAEGPIVLAGK
jgi:anti-sigma-K factor RskA